MADQTSVKSGDGRSNGVVGSITELGNDVATLAELQAKLAALDFKESVEHAVLPLGVVAAGLAVLLGGIPVLLLGVATLLASWWKINEGWTLVLVALVVILLAGAAVVVAGMKLPRRFQSFRRSREELFRNLSWIRTVLVHSGRSVPRRGS